MARSFNASTQYAQVLVSPVLAFPITLAGWFNPTSIPVVAAVVCLNNQSTTQEVKIDFGSSTFRAGANGNFSTTTIPPTTGVWHHGCGVFATSTSRLAYLDAVAGTANTTSVPSISLSGTTLGGRFNSSSLNGLLAEIAVWNIDLSANEVAALASGRSPRHVRPGNLVAYYPLYGLSGTTVEPDLSGFGNSLTLTGSPPAANHAPVTLFTHRSRTYFDLSAGGGNTPLSSTDLGSFLEAVLLAATPGDSDLSSLSSAASLALALGDVHLLGESPTAVLLGTQGDSASHSDAGSLSALVSTADSDTELESSSVFAGTFITQTDTASLIESSVSLVASLSSPDAASLTDTSSQTAGLTTSDALGAADTFTLTASLSTSDSSFQSDGQGVTQGGVVWSVSDLFTLADQATLSVTLSASDSAGEGESQSASASSLVQTVSESYVLTDSASLIAVLSSADTSSAGENVFIPGAGPIREDSDSFLFTDFGWVLQTTGGPVRRFTLPWQPSQTLVLPWNPAMAITSYFKCYKGENVTWTAPCSLQTESIANDTFVLAFRKNLSDLQPTLLLTYTPNPNGQIVLDDPDDFSLTINLTEFATSQTLGAGRWFWSFYRTDAGFSTEAANGVLTIQPSAYTGS